MQIPMPMCIPYGAYGPWTCILASNGPMTLMVLNMRNWVLLIQYLETLEADERLQDRLWTSHSKTTTGVPQQLHTTA